MVKARDLRGRQALAHLFHVLLMREQDRDKVVRFGLACLKNGSNINPSFEGAALETLYYRAGQSDLPEILALIDRGTPYGRKAGIALAAYVCKFPEYYWSQPAPHYVASRVKDLSAFRARVTRAIEDLGQGAGNE